MTDETTTRRVLVVDDDPLILEVLRTILHLRELEVSCANDGATALELLADGPLPNVIVCDVMMPGIDGLEVCRRIKGDPRTAEVPVILLTARDRAEDRAAGDAAGCDDYVTKPFSPLALTDRICEFAGLGPPRGSAASGSAPDDR